MYHINSDFAFLFFLVTYYATLVSDFTWAHQTKARSLSCEGDSLLTNMVSKLPWGFHPPSPKREILPACVTYDLIEWENNFPLKRNDKNE